VTPPNDERELLDRARTIGGRSIAEVARLYDVALPPDPKRSKGFVGSLVERALGATSGSSDGPDYPSLGIELKTLPVDRRGRVRESTFVCSASIAMLVPEWERSRARAKLSRVLFLVIESEPDVAPAHRRFGAAFLWSPSDKEASILRADYEDLTAAIAAGHVEAIDARRGQALQLRPKARDASVRTRAHDADGSPFFAAPRGFYLRARFTGSILASRGFAQRS
jgi:DNA mismatch repair protein MutH